MFWQKIGNSVSDRLFRDSVIAENQCFYGWMDAVMWHWAYSKGPFREQEEGRKCFI